MSWASSNPRDATTRASQLRGEGAEGIRLNRRISLSPRQPARADHDGPPVVLRGGREGLVLRGELRHRAPGVLLGRDGLVRGQFGADVL